MWRREATKFGLGLAAAGLLSVGLAAIGPRAPAQAQARQRKLAPRDESGRDKGVKAVIDALRAAAAAKAPDRLKPLLAEEVHESFGGDGSAAGFVESFRRKPALWAELETAIRLGGSFINPTTYASPYVYADFPDGLDGHRHHVVLGENVPLHEAPRDTAIVGQRLTHDIVRREAPEPGVRVPSDWLRVRPPFGQVGYVRKSYLRSPIDYRLVIEKRGERWLVTAFIAGD
ncbi:MAG: hypothetical protein JNK67_10225 [Alphaproteobacteria bacterium]|nr:hypothetical protein [Alphaproteobacteria bacterium]